MEPSGAIRPAAVIPTLELTPRKRPVASGATESLRCCAVHDHRVVVTASKAMLARLLICGARIPGSRGERRELEEGDTLRRKHRNYFAGVLPAAARIRSETSFG